MFIGRAIVEQLLLIDHCDITLYNRGKSNIELFPAVSRIIGDREQDDYQSISNRWWDIVVDCSGYYPKSFIRLLAAMDGKVGRYIFISTISVFDLGGAGMTLIDETYPTMNCHEEDAISSLPAGYGVKKSAMEQAAMISLIRRIFCAPSSARPGR